jgi:hypothetical protein
MSLIFAFLGLGTDRYGSSGLQYFGELNHLGGECVHARLELLSRPHQCRALVPS